MSGHRAPLSTQWVAEALQAHASALRRFVAARVRPSDVDDVLQMAALRAVERSGSIEEPERILSWLYRVHRNIIIDLQRKHSRQEKLAGAAATDFPGQSAPEASIPCDCSLVQAQRIKPSYAAVLHLVDAGEASLTEAAAQLNISTSNAYVRLHRARKALRAAMREHCGVESLRDCIDCKCIVDRCCAA